MITLKLQTRFKPAFSLSALFFMLVLMQTNKLCAQNTPNHQGFIPPQLQALKQQQGKRGETVRMKNIPESPGTISVANERTYVFTGKGSWFTATNWENNSVPPLLLKTGDHVIINGSGACLINNFEPILVPQGSSIEIKKGKAAYVTIGNNLVIKGDFINNGKLTVISGTMPPVASQGTSTNKGTIKTTRLSRIGQNKITADK